MRKENLLYYFSVEGETEKWYLEWLQKAINSEPSIRYTVKFISKIKKDPLSYAKGLTIVGATKITHIFDFESEESCHTQQFKTTLERMKAAEIMGKNIKYQLGYSNFAFELWMILHKAECNNGKMHRNQYLEPLNRAYSENFATLDEYKHEKNFKRLLKKLSVEDVKLAIKRSRKIMQHNKEVGYILQEYKGFEYFKENPSLSIWETIRKIFLDCGLMSENE